MHGDGERERERFSFKLYGMTTYPWSQSGGFAFICDIEETLYQCKMNKILKSRKGLGSKSPY